MKILVLNSGSSSLKYQVIDTETGEILSKQQGKSKLVEYIKENNNYTDFYSKLEKLLNEE